MGVIFNINELTKKLINEYYILIMMCEKRNDFMIFSLLG